jgi:hypothetical protein
VTALASNPRVLGDRLAVMKVPIEEVLRRTGEYFMGLSPVHRAAERISRALADMNIPFAIVGALAANAHGHVRTTADVDILLTPDGLKAFKERWLGLGWVEAFSGSKGLRDAENNVKIDVLLAGDYPGDGKPKPVVFPDPSKSAELSASGLPVLRLPLLLELKLASGMTAPARLQDLADVLALIRVNKLPRDYSMKLNEYVRAKFDELWQLAQIEEDY